MPVMAVAAFCVKVWVGDVIVSTGASLTGVMAMITYFSAVAAVVTLSPMLLPKSLTTMCKVRSATVLLLVLASAAPVYLRLARAVFTAVIVPLIVMAPCPLPPAVTNTPVVVMAKRPLGMLSVTSTSPLRASTSAMLNVLPAPVKLNCVSSMAVTVSAVGPVIVGASLLGVTFTVMVWVASRAATVAVPLLPKSLTLTVMVSLVLVSSPGVKLMPSSAALTVVSVPLRVTTLVLLPVTLVRPSTVPSVTLPWDKPLGTVTVTVISPMFVTPSLRPASISPTTTLTTPSLEITIALFSVAVVAIVLAAVIVG